MRFEKIKSNKKIKDLNILHLRAEDLTLQEIVKIFYEYLNLNPLMSYNEGFTILKKKKNREKDFEIIFSINKENNRITFPSTTNLGFLDAC